MVGRLLGIFILQKYSARQLLAVLLSGWGTFCWGFHIGGGKCQSDSPLAVFRDRFVSFHHVANHLQPGFRRPGASCQTGFWHYCHISHWCCSAYPFDGGNTNCDKFCCFGCWLSVGLLCLPYLFCFERLKNKGLEISSPGQALHKNICFRAQRVFFNDFYKSI